MPTIVYRINCLLRVLLRRVPLGTNLGLLTLFWTVLSGRLLQSRGALFPALADMGLSEDAVRRAAASLNYGHFCMSDLIPDWNQAVQAEGLYQPHCHGGIRPVPVDRVGFFRPKLVGCPTKHYTSQSGKALPAIVLGMVGATGTVGKSRLCLPRFLVEAHPQDKSEAEHQKRTVRHAAQSLAPDEALILDAGVSLVALLSVEKVRFVLRCAKNFTARKNSLPVYCGKGRHPLYGEGVRPLPTINRQREVPFCHQARWLRRVEGREAQDQGAPV